MKILIIGDIIIDTYYYSTTNRIAPEADIPVYDVCFEKNILGGSANVANNLKNLNCDVEIISVMGNDDIYIKCKEMLHEKNIKYRLFIDYARKSTHKNRVICKKKIVNRFDIENTNNINEALEKNIIEHIKTIQDVDAIILSDYSKGVLTENLCQKIINYSNANNILTFVDPKIKDFIKYKNCFCFKPNFNEATKISETTDIMQSYQYIKNSLNSNYIIITNGGNGLYINDTHLKINKNVKVVDVTGSGDVALCILTYTYIKYKDMILAGNIANFVCGKGVKQLGNYVAKLCDIDEYYNFFLKEELKNKIIYDNEENKLLLLNGIKSQKNVVFTNGCFDILHSAHIKLLQYAKSVGDVLIVGVNSDESIKKIKGEKRPINKLDERIELLSCFDFIDYIVVFKEETPFNILSVLKPHIIVKGGDYKLENVVGGNFAEKILLFNFVENKSTTMVIQNIIEKY